MVKLAILFHFTKKCGFGSLFWDKYSD